MTTSKKVQVIQKPGVTYFQHANTKWISIDSLRVGRYMKAVNEMIAKTEMNRLLLREIIGVDPDSPVGNWDNLLKEWWANVNISIPAKGLTLEVGLIYDVTDPLRKARIDEIKRAKGVTSITDEDLKNWVESKINYSDRCLYAKPVDTLNYLYYCFVLIHREVANSITDIDKSTNIRFYLYTEEEEKKIKEEDTKLRTEAAGILAELAKDSKKVIKALRVYNTLDDIAPYKITNDDAANLQNLVLLFQENPKLFITISKDKDTNMKAFVQELFENNLLEKLTGSNVIVLAQDHNVILGGNIQETMDFFRNDSNKETRETLQKQIKAIKL